MTNTELRIGRVSFRATDSLVLAALALFSLVAIVFAPKVQDWYDLVFRNVLMGLVYVAFIHTSRNITHRFWRFFVRAAPVTLAYAYLFGAVDRLQLVLHGAWLDDYILDLEQYIFGVQPTLWLEPYVSKPLTEWMMFSYVIYLPMYPVLCGIIYHLRGELAMEDYFFALGVTNILCDIGFILVPVAGPIPYIGQLYTVPLDGYVWTYFGELMRSHLHYVGGTIPSPHCAAATIMWAMAWRYHRTLFWALTPIVLSLYVSTFYGRYHYATDAIVGIAVAIIALAVAPHLIRLWERIVAANPTPV